MGECKVSIRQVTTLRRVSKDEALEMIKKNEEKNKLRKETTNEMLEKFEDLCHEYSCESIDPEMLKKGVIDTIDNFS